jgi:hypothetical protein
MKPTSRCTPTLQLYTTGGRRPIRRATVGVASVAASNPLIVV